MRSLYFLVPGDLQSATGGYAYDRRIVEGLLALRWDVRVLTLDSSFPLPPPAALSHAQRLLQDIPDDALVIIDGLALGAMPGVLALHAARLRLLALVHHPLAAESGLSAELARSLESSERQALALVRHVVVTSAATKDALGSYGVAPERISVVEPGTDPVTRVCASRRAQGLRILCVAAVIARKGHEVLLQALAPLAQRRWHLTCVGNVTRDPATVQRLEALLRHLALTERVAFTGEVDAAQLADFFGNTDLFVMPALYEGYGMAVAEALSYGLPVIATRTGAIPALLGQAGILVPPGDTSSLNAALLRVLDRPSELAALARQAQLRRAGLPRWPTACRAMAQVIETVALGAY